MAELLDDVSYLSQEVGPRPAGTEEEQQAALYIADKVHQRTGFHAEIEDIKCMANAELVDCIYFGVAFVCLLVAFLFPVSSIVTFILALVDAVLYFLERVQKRAILSRAFTRDISQNVVIKYKPGTESARMAGQPRKIVVVANYDSGRVRRETKPRLVGASTFLMKAGAVCLIASPLLILLRNIVLAGSLGVVSAVLSLLCVVALVFLFIPLVFLALHRFAPFNEAANNNASSIAVMLEVLRRIDGTAAPENAPRPRKAREEDVPVVHGERAAREAGVVPEGASLTYDDDLAAADASDEGDEPPYANDFAQDENAGEAAAEVAAPAVEDDSAEGRLRSAKAAIAALTGEAVRDDIYLDFSEPDEASPSVSADAQLAPELGEDAPTPEDDTLADAAAEEAAVPPVAVEAAEAAEAVAEGAAATLAAGVAGVATYAATKAPTVPDWYAAAQAKAHRRAPEPARRSRYADALDSAVRESESHFQRANSLVDEETEQRLRQMRESFAPPAEEAPAPTVAEPEPQYPAEPEPLADAAAEPVLPMQPQPEPELDSTAAFPPVGSQGQTVEFEAEFDLGEDEAEPVPAESAPQPTVEVEQPERLVEDEVSDEASEVVAVEEEPLEAEYEVIEAELVEEYAEDEYDEYSDFSDVRPRRGAPSSRRRGEKASRQGGLFSRLRDAVMPPAADESDEEYEEELQEEPVSNSLFDDADAFGAPAAFDAEQPAPAQPDADADALADASEGDAKAEVEAEGDYEDEYYDDEPSRFADLRERMSGAFTRFTSRIAPTPDYEEQDYSYDENEGYRFDDGYDEPAMPSAPEAVQPLPEDDVFAEAPDAPEPVVVANEQELFESAPEPSVEASPKPEQTVFIDDEMDVEEPAFEPQIPADATPAASGVGDIDLDDEEYYDEWEDEPERGGFMNRISGFWNRIVGRERDEYEYEEDAYDFAEDDESQVPEDEAPAPVQAAGAEELVYQTAYAPVRTKMKRAVAPAVDDGAEPADEPADVPEPAAVAEDSEPGEAFEAADAPEPAEVVEASEATEVASVQPVQVDDTPAGPDLSFQQVVIQSSSDEEVEAPIAMPSAESASSQARPANPRARRGMRTPAVSPWEKVASPSSTAPFTIPVTPDTTAPFQQIPEYMDELPGISPANKDAVEEVVEEPQVVAEAVEAEAPVEAPIEEPVEEAVEEAPVSVEAYVPQDADIVEDAVSVEIEEDAVEAPIIPVFDDEDEFAPLPDKTTAFAPIDVSELGDVEYPVPEEAALDDAVDAIEFAPEPEQGFPAAEWNESGAATPDVELPFTEAPETLLDEPDPSGRVKLPEIPLEGKQHAPLADAPITDQVAARSRLSSAIPVIDIARPAPEQAPAAPQEELSRTERMRRLHVSLPSMSGSISSDPRFANGENSLVSQTGSFAAVSATGNIDPVGDELVEDVPPEEIYVDDVDDTPYQEGSITETGAFAAPDYVQMPEKRRGLFGRRKNRKAEDEITPQQWLGVSDDFDARAVGKARGDWSSFQENDARGTVGDRVSAEQPTMGWRADRNTPDARSDYDTGLDSAFIDDEDDFLGEDHGMNNGRWNGGAFSGRRSGERDRYAVDDEDEWAEFAEYADENYDENAFLAEGDYAEDDGAEGEPEKKGGRLRGLASRFSRKDKGAEGEDASSRRASKDVESSSRSSRREPAYTPGENDAWNVAAARAAARSAVVNVMDDPRVQEELGETYGFVDDPIANEVWFVALGAGLSDNAGMKEFLDAHADELRGAMVINLEGIGDGELVGMASEGLLKQYKPTTRMKRFLRNAGQATGVRVGQAKMNWRDSAATVAMQRGISTITVAGVDGNVPIRYGSSDDVVEKLDEGTLKQRVNFVLELLRTI